MFDIDELTAKVLSYLSDADTGTIQKAFAYASKKHEHQKRKSGEPYVVHPIGVASLVAELKMDVASIVAALLHDSVEDTDATVEDLRIRFGPDVAFLVDSLTKISHLEYQDRKEKQAENFRKLLLGTARDVRVVVIKLADRLDNMRTLGAMRPDQQERISTETMDIYVPIANRLGIEWVKSELEDLAFRYLNPEQFNKIVSEVEKSEKSRRRFIEEVQHLLEAKLAEEQIPGLVSGRAKNIFGIYQKMISQHKPLDEVYDIVGFRVITETKAQCYAVLGMVHDLFTPKPGRFKDYISLPKPNGYQSLHTVVMWRKDGATRNLEIQIRTKQMHREAEEGVAAHWRYKEGSPLHPKDEKRYAWLRNLVEVQDEIRNPREFIDNVRLDLSAGEVCVFTPTGEVKVLPEDATPLDFAYSVHTELGHHCTGAKVNGVMVSLRYSLKPGDTVEIITSKHQSPSPDWLDIVKSSRARAKINRYLRTAERDRDRDIGTKKLEQLLSPHKLSLNKLKKSGELDQVAREHFHLADAEELILKVGSGKLLAHKVVSKLLPPEEELDTAMLQAQFEEPKGFIKRLRRSSNAILVQGNSNIATRLAKCCNPVPGDPIIGFITRGRGVTVHMADCRKAQNLPVQRKVDVSWDSKAKGLHPVVLRVHTDNKPGLLALMSKAFSKLNINILRAICRADEAGRAVNEFHFQVENLEQIKKVIRALRKIAGVYMVERVKE